MNDAKQEENQKDIVFVAEDSAIQPKKRRKSSLIAKRAPKSRKSPNQQAKKRKTNSITDNLLQLPLKQVKKRKSANDGSKSISNQQVKKRKILKSNERDIENQKDIVFVEENKKVKSTKRKTKKKKRNKKFEDKTKKENEIVWDKPSEEICEEDYRIFAPHGFSEITIHNNCVFGVDIGTNNLAITAISDDPEDPNLPRVNAVTLIDASDDSTPKVCDNLDSYFCKDKNFEWVFNVPHQAIEQQLPVNPSARIVASAIRSSLRTDKFLKGEEPDVCNIPAIAKYNLIHEYTDDPEWIGVPISQLKGHKNTKKRKLLGELHARGIWKFTNNKKISFWFKECPKWTTQKHDISDSFLIALKRWMEIKGISPKIKRERVKRVKQVKSVKQRK